MVDVSILCHQCDCHVNWISYYFAVFRFVYPKSFDYIDSLVDKFSGKKKEKVWMLWSKTYRKKYCVEHHTLVCITSRGESCFNKTQARHVYTCST